MRLARGSRRYVGLFAILALVTLPLSRVSAIGFIVLAGFVAWFFRDPDRQPPDGGIVSPADGTVSVIREEEERIRVGVFMNITDVHVNRAPIGGTVERVDHTAGAHRPAFTKDSDRNERVRVTFPDHEVVLIAGTIARRITPYVEAGTDVERGDRLGHIAFGSRADVRLPPTIGHADLHVDVGDSVVAGESILASNPAASDDV